MRLVHLDSKTLLQARASSVLALDASAFSGGVTIQSAAAATSVERNVAVVPVIGPMAQRGIDGLCGSVDGYDRLSARFAAAAADPEIGAIVLRIDSPGGDVAGLEEAVASMRRAKGDKPVYAFVDELAASAAYWIAAGAADEIYAPVSGRVGSIGCIGAVVDETAALAAAGLSVTLIREPEGKADGHPAGPVADLAIERATESVRAAASRFYAAVSGYRGISTDKIRALNGAVFGAETAMSAGLIDGVENFESVINRALLAIAERQKMDEKLKEAAAAMAAADSVFASARAVTGKDSAESIIGALHAHAQAFARVQELELKLAAESAARDAAAKAQLIAQLKSDKKLTACQVPWAESLSAEALKSYAAVAVSFGGPSVEDAKQVSMEPTIEAALKKFGLTADDYKKAREIELASGGF